MSKKYIKLSESQFNNFIIESVLSVINKMGHKTSKKRINENYKPFILRESQESKSQSEAIKLVMNKFNWNYDKANEFVRISLRNDLPSLRDKNIGKFTLGVTRMFCDGQLNDARIISNLNSTLKLMSAHLNEYDRNLNGLSAQELISRFEKTRNDNMENEKNEINSMQFSGQSNYRIIPINSFEESEEYYEYTNPNSPWCLTYMEDMFDSYTSNGINQIYFCLRNGFEKIKPLKGENCPLDEYGLSMISVIVNENGELAYCTSRWNHANGGNDSVMNAKELSQVIGVNFYDVFKPNNRWNELIQSAMERIRNGESPENVFDYVGNFSEGFAKVRLNIKWNVINTEGQLLSPNQWFDYVGNFTEGFAIVELNGKYNFINTEGRLLSPNQWFDSVGNFHEGFAKVELNRKRNFINTEVELLSPNQWFDWVDSFSEGFARVELNGKGNFINREGELLIPNQWFDWVGVFREGFAGVELNEKWNVINTEGRLLSPNQWFDYVGNFYEGFARVELNRKSFKINKKGELFNL